MEITIDIAVLLIIAGSAIIAYFAGFVKTFFGLTSTILAIVLACMFSGELATYVKEETGIYNWIYDGIYSVSTNYEKKFYETNSLNGETNFKSGDIDAQEIKSMIPELLNDMVNLDEIKTNIKNSIAEKISTAMINVLSWLAIYIVTKIIVSILTFIFNGIMQLPFLKKFNEYSGLGLGILLGIFRVYLVLSLIFFLSSIWDISNLITHINSTYIASWMYNNNLLMYLIF